MSMLALLIAAAVAQPGRDPTLLHRDPGAIVAAKEQEQEAALRRMLELGGSSAEQAEALARLAALLRSRGLALSIRAEAEADQGNEAAAVRDRRAAADARAEAVARYRVPFNKYARAPASTPASGAGRRSDRKRTPLNSSHASTTYSALGLKTNKNSLNSS